ncbi:somatotropin-like isoform X1 [Erpetoichthys calabaricus]|uniref:somatotropin-like isoform X1 n=1 Tax=Erpetoichthys calabaricus TaxID=27687 RepID=UPI002234B7DC|nr:somatotropin-like isoform X1 [Erpetoichthys calabaricus]
MKPGVMLFAISLVAILNSLGHMGDAPKMKLTRVFRNLVPRARHLHHLATAIYKEFERTYVPQEKRHSSKKPALCSSATIQAPRNKEETLQKSDVELLCFSLIIIQSWINPLKNLSHLITNRHIHVLSNRLLEKLRDLEEGIQVALRVLEKRSDRHMDTYSKFEVILPADGSVMKVPGLLACFRKDAHRVATYLNLVTFQRFA